MSRFNINTTHPLIKNANEYYLYCKYVTIYSGDRDVIKFPDPSEFEIELPQDICNIAGVCLQAWSFPQTPTFTRQHNNIAISFLINEPYNPTLYGITDQQQLDIYNGLLSNVNNSYVILIEEGSYNSEQIAMELQNKMNFAVTTFIQTYLASINNPDPTFQYKEFVVAYNAVSSQLWFGNSSSGFIFNNLNEQLYGPNVVSTMNNCANYSLPDFNSWGLPAYLGFNRCNISSIVSPKGELPRFFYLPDPSGYWISFSTAFPGGPVYSLCPPNIIKITSNPFYYLSINELNCMDETSPFSLNHYALNNNRNSGRANSSFARITVDPNDNNYPQWYVPNKLFVPPLERMRKLSISIHNHNGQLIKFNNQEFSMMLEFTIYTPQIGRNINLYDPKILY